MIQLIWSQDELLASEAADEAIASVGPEAEIVAIDADTGLDGLDEALFAGSLFAQRRCVVLRNAEALPKAGVARLSEALHREGGPDVVVVVAVSERSPSQLVDALKDVAAVKRLSRPRRGELVAWVAKRMKAAGVTPGRDAASTLVEAVGDGLRELVQAIDQLALRGTRGRPLERADVLEHFTLSADQPIWALFDSIMRHEGPKSFGGLQRLLRNGDEPLLILGALVSQIRGVIRAKSLIERSPIRDDDLSRALGVSPGRAAVLRRQASRLSWDWLLDVHRLCAEADVELKGGEDGAVLPPDAVLERLVAGALDAG